MPQEHLEELFKTVRSAGSILILPHNDPDPDAIASAVALRYLLAEQLGVASLIAYEGIIGRAENRALVNYLKHPLLRLSELELDSPIPVALVDTQPGAGNNTLPPHSVVVVVLDHHGWRETTARVQFADVRPNLGATSTILTEYLQSAGLEPPPPLATALFYGIKTDTRGLSRAGAPADTAAYLYLQSRLDVHALADIEHAQVPANYFKSFDTALRAARIYDGIVFAYLGPMDYPDLTAEMARLLLRLEKSLWVICMGVYQGVLILSVRTQSPAGGAEQLVQAIVGEEGAAGGHGSAAGGQVRLLGEDPGRMSDRLRRRALQILQVAPEVTGQPLI